MGRGKTYYQKYKDKILEQRREWRSLPISKKREIIFAKYSGGLNNGIISIIQRST